VVGVKFSWIKASGEFGKSSGEKVRGRVSSWVFLMGGDRLWKLILTQRLS